MIDALFNPSAVSLNESLSDRCGNPMFNTQVKYFSLWCVEGAEKPFMEAYTKYMEERLTDGLKATLGNEIAYLLTHNMLIVTSSARDYLTHEIGLSTGFTFGELPKKDARNSLISQGTSAPMGHKDDLPHPSFDSGEPRNTESIFIPIDFLLTKSDLVQKILITSVGHLIGGTLLLRFY
jgi:hypothetical protein